MFSSILLAALACILIMFIVFTYFLGAANRHHPVWKEEEKSETFQGYIYGAIILLVIVILLFIYLLVKGSPYEGHMMEWLNIIFRVMHVTFGIAWIGASFYFVFLENALNRKDDLRDELAGNLWAVHGGGFYYLEKYKSAPSVLPKKLHWFKYEAYFTWLSGFGLLFIVYYFNAQAFLVDQNVMQLPSLAAVSIGIGSFVVAWLLYDLICRTAVIKNGYASAAAGVVFTVLFAWLYTQVFNGRAAYIHFGAMLGTLMAGNVFFVIIPAQKALVKAAKQGKQVNAAIGRYAGLRSLHNNYFTLPVIFVMVSNHFPSTFGAANPWVILAVITLATAGIKHYLNVREKGQYSVWVLPVAVLMLLGAAFITAPNVKSQECKTEVSFSQVYSIVQLRCISCHSASPTDEQITAPPNGVSYDLPQNVVNLKEKIYQRVVLTKTMPQNNKTGMTEEEREIIRCWIEQGATLK